MKFHPLMYAMARLRTRAMMRNKGIPFHSINDAMEGWDTDLLDSVGGDVPPELKAPVGNAALGDGSIIQAIIDFFKSPLGQSILQAIMMLLLSLIGL